MVGAKKRLLLIGGGLTASLIAAEIAQNGELANRFDVSIWEKASTPAGRFSSQICPVTGKSVDIGAQFLTQTEGNEVSREYFQELLAVDLLRPLDTSRILGFRQHHNKRHYACTQGTSAIVKHLLTQASCTLTLNKEVKGLSLMEAASGSGISPGILVNDQSGDAESFDLVISTIPPPLFLQLENTSDLFTIDDKENGSLLENLGKVEYSSRYALSLFYDTPRQYPATQEPITFLEPTSAPIRYWAIEDWKRSGERDTASRSGIVIHSCTDAENELNESDYDKIKSKLLGGVNEIPELSNSDQSPCHAFLHRWKYSQVTRGYPGRPGFVVLRRSPLLLATGDGFTESTFVGCITAASNTIRYLLKPKTE